MSIERVNGPTTAPLNAAKKADDEAALAHQKTQIRQLAGEFEAVLLRQMIASGKLCGQNSESGYGAMAVDALASSVTKSGGFGFARALADSLDHFVTRAHGPAVEPAKVDVKVDVKVDAKDATKEVRTDNT